MRIKSRCRSYKIEFTRRRKKCLCCTRFNYREELVRRAIVKEAQSEL